MKLKAVEKAFLSMASPKRILALDFQPSEVVVEAPSFLAGRSLDHEKRIVTFK